MQAIQAGLGRARAAANSAAKAVFSFQTALGLAAAAGSFAYVAEDFRKAEQAAVDAAQGSTEALEKLKAVSREVWINGFGANAEEAAKMAATAFKELGDVSEEELGKATIAAKQLEERFGADYEKSIQSMGVLMREFGLSSQEAMDFVAAGFQENLNASGDFLDSITEYAPQFEKTKAGAEAMFNGMAEGAQRGVLGVDKSLDMIKEFGIRIIDGSKGTKEALESIGISSEKMAQAINDGTLTSSQAFTKVQTAIKETEDATVQFQAGAALLGSPFEDMGVKAALAIDLTKTKMEDLKGSTEKLNQGYVGLVQSVTKLSREFIDAFSGEVLSSSKKVEDQINAIIKVVRDLKANGALKDWADGAGQAFSIVLGWVKDLIAYIPELNRTVQSSFAEIEIQYNKMNQLLNEVRAWGAKLSGNAGQEEYFQKAARAAEANADALKGVQKEIETTVIAEAKLPEPLDELNPAYVKAMDNIKKLENGTLKWGKATKDTKKDVEDLDVTVGHSAKEHAAEMAKGAAKFEAAYTASLENVGNKIEKFSKTEIDVNEAPAVSSFDKIGVVADGTIVKVEGPYSMQIDEDPTIAAFERLAVKAVETATAAKQSLIEMQESLQGALGSGDGYRLLTANIADMQGTYDRAIDKHKKYTKEIDKLNTIATIRASHNSKDLRGEFGKPIEATVEFKGKASPTKPLSETIKDVAGKMDGLKKSIAEPADFETYFQDMGVKDGLYDISTLLDRTQIDLKDAVTYIGTAMGETVGYIKAGVDPAKIAQPYYEMGKLISAEAKNMGETYGTEILQIQKAFKDLQTVMNKPLATDSQSIFDAQALQAGLLNTRNIYEQSTKETQAALKSTITGIRDSTLAVNQDMINKLVSDTKNILSELGADTDSEGAFFKNAVSETETLLQVLYQKIENSPSLEIDVSQAQAAIDQIKSEIADVSKKSLLDWEAAPKKIAMPFDRPTAPEGFAEEAGKGFLNQDLLKMKNLGQMQFNVGHNGFPAFMDYDAAKQLQDTLRKQRLVK